MTQHAFHAIEQLDLDPIKVKLMHEESGEGWSLEHANAVEQEYRRFLCLMKKYPEEQVAPLMDVDIFWHYHILDTMKYAADCDALFGYFLHHFPYVGLRGEVDEEAHHRLGERMKELYEETFGEDYIRVPAAANGAANGPVAWSGAPGMRASATVAWSGAPNKSAGNSAVTAWSGAPNKSAVTAWSGAPNKSAVTAWSGAPNKSAVTAWSGAPNKSAVTAWSGAPNKSAVTAWSGAPNKGAVTAWSGAPNKRAQEAEGAVTAWSGAPAQTAATVDSFYTERPRLTQPAN